MVSFKNAARQVSVALGVFIGAASAQAGETNYTSKGASEIQKEKLENECIGAVSGALGRAVGNEMIDYKNAGVAAALVAGADPKKLYVSPSTVGLVNRVLASAVDRNCLSFVNKRLAPAINPSAS